MIIVSDYISFNFTPNERLFWIQIILMAGLIFLTPMYKAWFNKKCEENRILDRIARHIGAKSFGRNIFSSYVCLAHHNGTRFTFIYDSQDNFSHTPAFPSSRAIIHHNVGWTLGQ